MSVERESLMEAEHIQTGILFTCSLQCNWGNVAVVEAIQRQVVLFKHTHLSPQCDCSLRSLEAETHHIPLHMSLLYINGQSNLRTPNCL